MSVQQRQCLVKEMKVVISVTNLPAAAAVAAG